MKNRCSIVALVLALGAFGATPTRADTPGEDGVDVIYLLKDCAGAGKNLGTDCYQTVADLQDAIWDPTTGINPTAAAPLVVDIGVGDFTGKLECSNGGHVSFRGVGRDHSRIIHPGPEFNVNGTFEAVNCDKLEFQDLALINHSATFPSFPTAVSWAGSGSSTWTDVHLEGDYAGWFDFAAVDCTTSPPIHYFFGSLIVSGGHYGYVALCGEHWVYGSEVRMRAKAVNLQQAPFRRGVLVGETSDFRIFGSTIRSHPDPSYGGGHDFIGVQLGGTGGGGVFHMHGGIISVASNAGDAIGIDSQASDTLAHTLGTAFALNPGTGDAIRVQGPGKLRTPLLWEAGTTPPTGSPAGGSTSVISQTGKDMYVETDCDATDCNGKSDPHLMIYASGCSPEPWFDVVRGECD